jgi:hypothetical protein
MRKDKNNDKGDEFINLIIPPPFLSHFISLICSHARFPIVLFIIYVNLKFDINMHLEGHINIMFWCQFLKKNEIIIIKVQHYIYTKMDGLKP